MPRKQKTEPAPIGEKIRSIRQDRGITLEQLANETGQSIATLEKIESGNMVPPVGTLLSISRTLFFPGWRCSGRFRRRAVPE